MKVTHSGLVLLIWQVFNAYTVLELFFLDLEFLRENVICIEKE